MMQAEKVAEDLRDAHEVIAGANSGVPALAGVIRRLERRSAQAPSLVEPAVKALDAALTALEETRGHLEAGAAHRRFRSRANSSASRSACSRCARPAANTTCRWTSWRRWRRATDPISR